MSQPDSDVAVHAAALPGHEQSPGSELLDLQVEERQIDALKPCRGNPRTHSTRQIRQIADSILESGSRPRC